MSDKEDLQVTVDGEGFAVLAGAKDSDPLVTETTDCFNPSISNAEPTIVIPRKAIPDDQERLRDFKKLLLKQQAVNVSKAKPFSPIISVARPRVKPEKYERFDDYVARCGGLTPPKENKVNDETRHETVKQISTLSKALLKEVDEGRVFHVSDRKSLKQKVLETVRSTKQKLSHKKDETFWKTVKFVEKVLKVRGSR